MGFKKRTAKANTNLNLTSMIDITSFILMALAILSITMKKEASLDNILRLPGILYATKQDTTQLSIYILPAKILSGGLIDPDSTGLVAFTDKSKAPDSCPKCQARFRNTGVYVPNSLLDQSMKPLAAMEADVPKSKEEQAKEEAALKQMRPPVYYCANCKNEISPYLKLDEIATVLREKKKKVVKELVDGENLRADNNGLPHLSPEAVKKIGDDLPLMIKADERAFYGRILQVVNMAKDTACNIKKFAFVSLAEASLDAQKKKEKSEK